MKILAALLLTLTTSTVFADAHPNAPLVRGESVAVSRSDSNLIALSVSGDTADKLMNAMSDDLIVARYEAKETMNGVAMVVKKGESISCSRYVGNPEQLKAVTTKVWCTLGEVYGPTGGRLK